ncbi:MAG TPA: MarR family transcriptional regulator [Nocardioidaceae bacterium]|nr:MarR family transcriptional regulator [Nocardioidaceae bacterium]
MARANEEELLRAVERLAGMLYEAGMPRMAARVFSYALADDAEHYSAAELADALRVSPAAISGAVRWLVDARLLFKEREPGSRTDLYVIHDEDVWSAITLARAELLETWEDAVEEAAKLVGTDHRGGRRLLETKEFFRFNRQETVAMIERWKQHRRTLS